MPLAYFVTVTDILGQSYTYGPDDEVPPEHAEMITNPSAWAEEPSPPVTAEAQATDVATLAQLDLPKLRALAQRHDVEVGERARKADIVSALTERGITP